jgi:hypothetical protein
MGVYESEHGKEEPNVQEKTCIFPPLQYDPIIKNIRR